MSCGVGCRCGSCKIMVQRVWSSPCGSGLQIQLVSMRMRVRSLALLSGLRIRHYRELGCRLQMGLRSVWLWLWCRPAAAAPIRTLAWEPLCAAGAALKRHTGKEYELHSISGRGGGVESSSPPGQGVRGGAACVHMSAHSRPGGAWLCGSQAWLRGLGTIQSLCRWASPASPTSDNHRCPAAGVLS